MSVVLSHTFLNLKFSSQASMGTKPEPPPPPPENADCALAPAYSPLSQKNRDLCHPSHSQNMFSPLSRSLIHNCIAATFCFHKKMLITQKLSYSHWHSLQEGHCPGMLHRAFSGVLATLRMWH